MTSSNRQSGFVLLIACVVLLAIGTIVAVSLLVVGVWDSKAVIDFQWGDTAKANADACTEIALNKIRLDPEYAGNETIQFASGSCSIEPVVLDGITYALQSIGVYESATRRVQAFAVHDEEANNVTVTRWEEISDFE
jgi:hypothetical protein